MTNIYTQSQETLTREDQIDLAGLDTEAEQPLEIEQQYRIKEDAPEQIPVEEKPLVRSLFIYGMTGLGLLFLIGIWQLMTPQQAPIKVVESPSEKQEPVGTPEVDYRGKLALRDQKHQLEQQQPTSAEVTKPTEPVTPAPIKQPTQPQTRSTPQSRVVRTAPISRPRTQPTPRPQAVRVESKPKIDPQQRWAQLSNFGRGVPIVSSQLAKNQTPTTKTTFVNNVADKSTTLTANVTNTPSPGSLGILNRQPVESTAKNNYQIAYGTTVTAEVSIPLLWDESVDSSSQPNKRFALILTNDLLASNGKVALSKGSVVVAESHSVNPDNRLVNASAIAIVYTDRQGSIQQRSLSPQKLTILGKQQQPLIAKGHFDRGGDYAKTDLLVSSLAGLGKVGEVFTQPNTTSSVVSSSFGSNVTTIVDNRNREVWSALLDGFFNPLAERISDRSLRQETELEQLPNIAVLEVGTEVSLIANDSFIID
ncbi:hypothetical protein Sta7437_4538 (plasmid) [Stanieria cyanosphaera PCC 7437]|uniref:Conjugation TrbI family protein n=1 Tax=Stanieria cyanosphaera (strain ATCC 29371 / PCC 7437) TaxID=111780 RepID=K9XZH7_STAC7|nr:hypothetical protein [Stanieria cyanosphaera]AFZ38000.1 hypothetical protein Sta7437_4538 [Stanieria cyanosphaera PCC 7437]